MRVPAGAGKTRRARRAHAKPPPIAIVMEEKSWRKEKRALRLMRRAARLALEMERAKPLRGGGITILLANDSRLKKLNADFRRAAKPTNVLSFRSDDPGYLGDIAIAYGVLKRESRAQGKRFSAHAAHLAAHGVLHLLGHDHVKKAEAKRMETLEREILARMGLADPYAQPGKAA